MINDKWLELLLESLALVRPGDNRLNAGFCGTGCLKNYVTKICICFINNSTINRKLYNSYNF